MRNTESLRDGFGLFSNVHIGFCDSCRTIPIKTCLLLYWKVLLLRINLLHHLFLKSTQLILNWVILPDPVHLHSLTPRLLILHFSISWMTCDGLQFRTYSTHIPTSYQSWRKYGSYQSGFTRHMLSSNIAFRLPSRSRLMIPCFRCGFFFLHFGVPDPKHNPLNPEDLCGVCCPLATYFS